MKNGKKNFLFFPDYFINFQASFLKSFEMQSEQSEFWPDMQAVLLYSDFQ